MKNDNKQQNKKTEKKQPPSIPNFEHSMSIEEFRENAHEMIDYICDYYKTLEDKPVLSRVQPGYLEKLVPSHPPQEGESFQTIMKDINKVIEPGITHWQHPSFFAYYPANVSFTSMLGDMLSTAYGCIGFSWICSPACTELETIVLDWLGSAIGLSDEFLSKNGHGGGVIQGTASEAALVTMLAARSKKINEHCGKNEDDEEAVNAIDPLEIHKKLVCYTSDQAHSCVQKAAMVAGITTKQCRFIKSNPENLEMDTNALKSAIKNDIEKGYIPFYVASTLGTTATTAIDDLHSIGRICHEFNVWHHVDAAFAGSALILPEYQEKWIRAKGKNEDNHGQANTMNFIDSFDFNPHKFMLCNFDCSALWVKERKHLQDALSLTPNYLRNKHTDQGTVIDYRDWQVPLGRRFRALKLWMTLRNYGIKGIRKFISHKIELAKLFESLIRDDEKFEILYPRTLTLVCFRLKNRSNNENQRLLDAVNDSGEAFLTHAVISNTYFLRLAIGGASTQEEHVRHVYEMLDKQAQKILQ